ncbi:MAG TPA: helix-turn-helix domain-containing protein, partial [Crenalkalicoccus sp.]|nr:helix-turn-helix domain-containing protein [Crenalkalicoccus sp.]
MPDDLKRISRPEPAAGDAARVGEELRDTRLGYGLSLEDMAGRLRIRRAHLQAIEEGRWRDLPAPAYALGFARSYARELGLDDEALVRQLRDVLGGGTHRRTDLVFPEPVPDRGVPAGAVILLGTVLAIGAYLG